MAMKTFDNFFGYVHHIPTFAFLHRASLMQRFHAGLVEKSLLLALVGVTSLMTDLGPGTRDLGTRCITEAEALALGGLERPSTLALQTLVFVVHHRILSGRFSSAFMLHGVASRLASALRLEHEDNRLCFLARESRRRLMWALYMIDVSMASSQIDSSLWMYKSDAISIQLPCNERNFEFDIPELSEPLRPPKTAASQALPPLPDSTGFLALHVRIHFLRGRILQYTKNAVQNPQVDDIASIPTRCAVLAGELEAFAARLPASFRWSEANVRLRTYSPRLCVFLMTHVWWEQCFIDLYRFALPNLEGALPAPYAAQLEAQCPDFVQYCRRQTYKHAMAMVGIFRLLLALDSGIPVTDLDLPICLHQCARMLHYFRQTDFYEATALQQEPVIDSIQLCVRVLDRCIKAPATLRIRENLGSLIGRELAQLAPSVPEHTGITDAEMDGMYAVAATVDVSLSSD
ncbi:nitrate assimilation regulatory protein [Grosmannia clavigera kw1407]|uniref:Nitrate assimilation regulatory protein n=1 Tax=Grosmannia clavigera (strain kw1407 / UAMH 11150) TaxID=655863 RepID=F0XNU6_GROCL|nr:nitrate assimilation regulatory protein [Grosmannia clavigera kw1407]EFX00646.1 nitrate assimilation regulatory protein [Grosmannia clavigera kw1407]